MGIFPNQFVSIDEFTTAMDTYGKQGTPFLFIIDFEMQQPLIYPLQQVDGSRILYKIGGNTNVKSLHREDLSPNLTKYPVAIASYKRKFDKVWSHLLHGDTYLTNLTVKTKVTSGYSLKEIFDMSSAKYKLWFEDRFVVFSPEPFVRISDGMIYSYPMKGTIDAAEAQAESRILTDPKEMAEHVTIVDLIRNDLSAIASNVEVTRFRYIEKITTAQKDLLQVSSEIRGQLPEDYLSRLGSILKKLLPAGSVSGAPKPKTLEIIRSAEGEPRGYYTGVVGLFDGQTLDSGVMIRFMERSGTDLYYRSGGGITTQSVMKKEYQEAIDKVYVPLD